MKNTITERFLWDAYKLLEKTGDVADFILSSPYKKARILTGGQNPVFRKYEKEMGRREFGRIIYYLKTKNYIISENIKGKQAIMLTKGGISKALKASFSVEKKEKRKDGKWIMLTFDIPQNHKKARELLRGIIHNLGYKMFQQSIWVCPFNVSEMTEKLLQLHNLEKYARVFLIEELEQESVL